MKNRQNPLIKAVLAVTLATGLSSVVQAYESESELEPVRDDKVISIGLGAFLGAIVGGPPGFIIGMVGMNAVDDYQHNIQEEQSASLVDQDEPELVAAQESRQQTVEPATCESHKAVDVQVASLSNVVPDEGRDQLVQALTTHFEQWVQFRTAQAELEPHLQKQLVRAATWMSQMPSVRIELHGFTDPRGADQDNMALSRARLDSVRRALIAGGIEAEQITGFAHGESLPLYNFDDTESNHFERRVLISFQVQGVRS